jgi:transcriptional regulator with XRE-family HTH domain
MGQNVSEQIRKAMDASKLTRYQIAKQTGIDQATLSRFYHREGSLSLRGVEAICDCLGLKLVKAKAKQDRK